MSNFQCEKCGVIHCDNGKDGYSLHQGELKTINTFEELVRNLGGGYFDNIVREERILFDCPDARWAVKFDVKRNVCSLEINGGRPFQNLSLQQAYNIANAIKQNIYNEPIKHLQKITNNEQETKV